MQLIPRYLVSNRTDIVANVAGFITEYRPVYTRHLQVYRGIDNVLEFKILNADQKAIDITNTTVNFTAFDEDNRLVIQRSGTNSSTIKGLTSVTITDSDTLDLKDQYLKYTVYLTDSNSQNTLTYSSSHFAQAGVIQVSSKAFPGPKESLTASAWSENADAGIWYTDPIKAEPAINGNEALHTVAFYATGYVGSIDIQTSLHNTTPITDNYWDTYLTVTFDGTETEPRYVNFNGVFSYLKFVTTTDPTSGISKILVRN